MEKQLDEVENGKKDWKAVVTEFLSEFTKDLEHAQKEFFSIDFETNMVCETCEGNYRLRVGKYGLYLNCPSCKVNKSINSSMFGVLYNGKLYFIQEEQENGQDGSESAEEEKSETKRTFYRRKSKTTQTRRK